MEGFNLRGDWYSAHMHTHFPLDALRLTHSFYVSYARTNLENHGEMMFPFFFFFFNLSVL